MFNKTARYKKYENMRNARARHRLEGEPHIYPAILPNKRREITIVDYDFGKRTKKIVMEKYRDRNDQYKVIVDGKTWSKPRSWSYITAKLREAYPRIRAI